MYIFPQPHRCNKCGHQGLVSQHDMHPEPLTSNGDRVCPRCWDEFITEHCGIMRPIAPQSPTEVTHG